jgi:AcrR family transcriptional regulator
MPPTAMRLLEAARRILREKGYAALTYRAIAEEAGESATPINRYFGSKDGLVLALMEWLFQGISREVYLALRDSPSERMQDFQKYFTRIVSDSDAYALYFELVVHARRHPRMRQRLAEVMAGYRRLNAWWFSPDGRTEVSPEIADLAALTVAVTDGMAMQLLADQESVDAERALGVWADFLRWRLTAQASADEPDCA